MEWRGILALFFFLFSCLQTVRSDAESITEQFDVRPGGESHKAEKALGSFKCTFLYKAQGGTNEKWEMTLDKDEFGAHSCTVTRPDGPSYIFFLQFKMKVAGARLTEVEAIGGQEHPLEPEEYVVSKRHNEVHSKKDAFKSTLKRLTVYAEHHKQEL